MRFECDDVVEDGDLEMGLGDEQRPRFIASSKRSLWSQARGVRIARAPSTPQRMPLCLSRCVTSVLHAASATPEPIMKPFDFISA